MYVCNGNGNFVLVLN